MQHFLLAESIFISKRQKYYLAFSDIVEKVCHYYPFFNKQAANNFKKAANSYRPQIKKILNDEEFVIFAKRFIASLGHSHAKIVGGASVYRPKNHQIKYIGSKFYLFSWGKLIGEVITIDTFAPKQILKNYQKYISASTLQYSMVQGLQRLLDSKNRKSAIIKIKTEANVKIIKLARVEIKPTPVKAGIKWRLIKNQIGYLKISAWRFSEADYKKLKKIIREFFRLKIGKIIIDVRGNGGGRSKTADELAGHFFKNRVCFGKSFDYSGDKKDYFVLPQKPFIKSSIIILADSYCLSSTELFIAGLKDNKKAIIFGEKTGGGTGNPKKFEIDLDKRSLSLYVPTWVFYRKNGELIEGRGIKPDIEIKNSIVDLKNKKDLVLDGAVNYLLNKKS